MFSIMSAQNVPASRSRSPLWASRLWILSAALGAASLGSAAAIVHDTGRMRAAAGLVAKATAEQVASAAAGRLEILAVETFAPVAPWDARPLTEAGPGLDRLVRAQRAAERCACRDTLPVAAFFHLDEATGKLDLAPVANAPSLPAPSAIEAVARADANRPQTPGHSRAHFAATAALGEDGMITVIQTDERGLPLGVYGLVASARDIARTVFVSDTAHFAARGSSASAVPDMFSLEVRPEGLPAILGSLDADRSIRATTFPAGGALQGLGITVALTRGQAVHSLFISRQEMWHVGVLTLATILVIVFAVGSSRRELLLARARSDFIAGVSHDLRMPLAQILIASETLTLRRERDETERLTLSSSIVREARRLIAIVDNVLLFSRSGAVALRPRLQPLVVADVFEDVIEAVKLAVEDAGQIIDAHDTPPLVILGDRQLVRQALVNLVDNALKYGAPGQRIRLAAERHAGTSVRLYVEDQGPGVPQDERARIFEPYERLGRDQTSERTGAGLGLAVVRHIAQVCGGRVWLDESPSGGTRAVFELPAAELPDPIVLERALV
jgi:signal transduction histidine kinase